MPKLSKIDRVIGYGLLGGFLMISILFIIAVGAGYLFLWWGLALKFGFLTGSLALLLIVVLTASATIYLYVRRSDEWVFTPPARLDVARNVIWHGSLIIIAMSVGVAVGQILRANVLNLETQPISSEYIIQFQLVIFLIMLGVWIWSGRPKLGLHIG